MQFGNLDPEFADEFYVPIVYHICFVLVLARDAFVLPVMFVISDCPALGSEFVWRSLIQSILGVRDSRHGGDSFEFVV